jgi:thiamine-monophosphate kinase
MDNTDGVYQSFLEICQINDVSIEFDFEKLPIHEVSYKVAKMINKDICDIIFAAGADFQLLGTISEKTPKSLRESFKQSKYSEIGKVVDNVDNGVFLNVAENKKKLDIEGWNYYSRKVKSE